MVKFYAQQNMYATEASTGFANTWFVFSFDSRTERDSWVAASTKLGTAAITLPQARKLAGAYQRHLADHGGYLAHHHMRADECGDLVAVF